MGHEARGHWKPIRAPFQTPGEHTVGLGAIVETQATQHPLGEKQTSDGPWASACE